LTRAQTSGLHYRAVGPEVGALLVLGHGAGAGQTHPFMVRIARALAQAGCHVVTFNFAYREAGRKLPDPAPKLEATFAAALAAARPLAPGRRVVVGGKSMGGRIASQLAARDAAGIDRLVFLGYPLHPPKKPTQRRAAHLTQVGRPMLFVQGERDPFGGPEELAQALAGVAPPPRIFAVPLGDHSFKAPRSGGRSEDEIFRLVVREVVAFVS
jgi:predicted alpha/beta-hydrolase family hydrolase